MIRATLQAGEGPEHEVAAYLMPGGCRMPSLVSTTVVALDPYTGSEANHFPTPPVASRPGMAIVRPCRRLRVPMTAGCRPR